MNNTVTNRRRQIAEQEVELEASRLEVTFDPCVGRTHACALSNACPRPTFN